MKLSMNPTGGVPMRKPGTVLSGIMWAVTFGAFLTGCPVWDGDGMNDRDGGVFPTDTPVTPRTCSTDANCPVGYCNRATNQCVTSTSCTQSSQCPGAYYCDSRNVCVPGGCSSNADCTGTASGLVCDTTARRCVPGGRCTSDAQCASTPTTPVCLGGSCQPRASQCQFDYQCTGAGQACVDGRCVVGCNAANAAQVCAAGQVCTNGRCAYPSSGACASGCPTGQICVTGACLRTCNQDGDCGSGQMCDYGVCRVDTRPRPFCTMDSQCNTGSVCYNGACRLLCPPPGMGSEDCMRVDNQFNLCRPDGMGRSLCTSTNEQMPQCARTADCMAGRACVNARCQ